jgi:hypothetical protein
MSVSMRRTRKLAKALFLPFCLTFLMSCSQAPENELEQSQSLAFETLEEFKSAFVRAGGQCWGWTIEEIPSDYRGLLGRGACDDKTVLMLFVKDYDVMKDALTVRKGLLSLEMGVSLLVGDNWLLNSDQVQSVHNKMGGTLITR